MKCKVFSPRRFGYYVVSVGWRGPDVLSVLYQNREQNISYHSLCHRASQAYTCQVVSTQYSLKCFFGKKLLKVQIVFFYRIRHPFLS